MKIIKTLTQAGSVIAAIKAVQPIASDLPVLGGLLVNGAAAAGGLYVGSVAGEYVSDLMGDLVKVKVTVNE